VKLVHLVGFITKKFVTMHGHMNVKLLMYTSTVRDIYITMLMNVQVTKTQTIYLALQSVPLFRKTQKRICVRKVSGMTSEGFCLVINAT